MILEIIHIGIVYMIYDNHRGYLPDPSDRVIRAGNFVQAEKPFLQTAFTQFCRSTFTQFCRSTFTQFCRSTFQVRYVKFPGVAVIGETQC